MAADEELSDSLLQALVGGDRDYHKMCRLALHHAKLSGLCGQALFADFNVQEVCSVCHQVASKPKRCGGCKASIYCSPSCAKKDWKDTSRQQPHKEHCPKMKKWMELVPRFQEHLSYFGWGYMAKDDTFPERYVLADLNLLGSVGYGYWSTAPTLSSLDQENITEPGATPDTGQMQAFDKQLLGGNAAKAFIHGYALLGPSFGPEKLGWRSVPDSQIPWHGFAAHPKAEPKPLDGRILSSWKEWYEWRGLTPESPAALVIHRVMTVYFMLTVSLGYAPRAADAPAKELSIAFLGAESELNCIPTFAELALLLPGYDFKLTFVGPSVFKLCNLAETKHPSSLAATPGPQFHYTAPATLGGSTVSVSLQWEEPFWSQALIAATDVAIALNAGIGAYPRDWWPVLTVAIGKGMPFISSEYTEYSLELCVKPILNTALEQVIIAVTQKPLMREEMGGDKAVERLRRVELKKEEEEDRWRVRWNPFMKPGQRQIPVSKLPNCDNGFVIEVIT